MKRTLSLWALPLCLLGTACNNPLPTVKKPVDGYIPKDTALLMTNSYLQSLQPVPPGKLPDVHYWIMNADLLRDYLSNPMMVGIEVKLAHTLEYIHAGHAGEPAGYESGALTIVLNGYDSSGHILYGPPTGTTVPNHALPCPYSCIIPGPIPPKSAI